MQINLDLILKAASFILSLGAMIYAYFANRQKDVDRRFDDGAARMDRHDRRIASLEHHVQSLPSKEDIYGLKLAMSDLSGELGELRAVIEGNAQIMGRQGAAIARIEEYLLHKGVSK